MLISVMVLGMGVAAVIFSLIFIIGVKDMQNP